MGFDEKMQKQKYIYIMNFLAQKKKNSRTQIQTKKNKITTADEEQEIREKKEVEQVSRDLIEAKNLIKSKPSPSKKSTTN